MKWHRLYGESANEGKTSTIPVEVSTKELKLIQNYLRKGKPLNDPSNKECLEVVMRILNGLVQHSNIEELDTYVANFLFENLGIEMEIDPYGDNSTIELAENGMIHLSDCEWMDLREGGQFSDRVQGGFWDDYTGELEEGFISVDDMNEVLSKMHVGNGIKSIQLKQDGKVAKLLLDFN
jgi:hypothetical protein